MRRFAWFSFVLGFAILVFVASAHADITSRIRGTVTDQSGAAIPQAKVTAVETQTGYTRTAVTDASGNFELAALPAGVYKVTIEKGGFQVFSQGNIKLLLNQIYVLQAQLQVGEVTKTVEVTAHPVQVETTSMEHGQDIQNTEFKDLPLLNRNWIQLQQTVPGVVASSDRFGNNFSTNGSRTQSNNYLINGGDSNDEPLNTPLDQPSPDAIQEVNVITSTLNPEYGKNSGAIMNAITKTGTNQFHGSAFEFYRDTFLNARQFFSTSVPPFHQNQFGGTIGGPFIKNKLFGFFSFQRTKSFHGTTSVTHVFSTAERTGNWSGSVADLSGGTSPFPLYGDSLSPCPYVSSSSIPCAAGTAYTSLFSTGVVPTQDFTLNASSALANAYWSKYVPPPTPGLSGNRFSFANNTASSTNQYLGTIDFEVSPSDRVAFYGFAQPNRSQGTLPFVGANLPGFGESGGEAIYQWDASETHIFNPNMINDLHFIYNRFNFLAVIPTNPTLPSSFSATTSSGAKTSWSINPQNTAGAGLPTTSVTGLFRLGFSEDGPQPRIDDTGELTDNFTYIHGAHSWKFGIDFRRSHVNNPFNFLNNGVFEFLGIGAYSTGIPGLDFQLGMPDYYIQSSGGYIDARTWEYYSYIQDQWKVLPSLTLTYGAGWQIDTPLTDHANHGVAINAFQAGQQSTVYPTAPTGLLFPGDQGVTASGYRTRLNNFAPRFGFAYAPLQKWSIRGGWGIYYDNSEEEMTLQNLLAPPFSLIDYGITDTQGFFTPSGTPSFNAPYTSLDGSATLTNKYPFTPPPLGSNVDFSFFEPFSLNVIDPHFNTPYVMNFNLGVEHQLSGNIVAQIAYVGSLGRRLETVVEKNPYNAQIADPNIFGSIGQQGTWSTSNYNSLQMSVQKAFSHGLFLHVAYTYSHALDNCSSFENCWGTIIPSNYNLTYGDSAYDARHRLVIAYDYHIPSLHRFLSILPSRIFDGWGLSGVTTFQTGFPITLSESDAASGQCNPGISFYGCWDRPNIVAPVKYENPRAGGNYWFNPSSFTPEAPGTIGNAGRNFFHGPGINNWDFSVFKDTRITERTSFQMRIDFFNGWNHAQFSNPDGNVNDGSAFGQISGTQVSARIIQIGAHLTF